MLLERATGLANKITEYINLRNLADDAQKFQTRANQFETTAERLNTTEVKLSRLKDAGIPVTFKNPDVMGLASKAKLLRESVQKNPAELDDPPFNLKYDFTDRLLGICNGADADMTNAWQRYAAEYSKLGSDEVLNALNALHKFRASVAKIRRFRLDILELERALPPDPAGAVKRLSTLVADYRSAWTELTADGIPTAVITFLRACATEGAPISDFTEEVRNWLQTRKLLNAFRITIG